MRSSYVVSAFIALLIVLWVGSGQIASLGRETVDPPSLADVRAKAAARTADAAARTRVRARIIQARDYTRRVNVTGRTEVNRSVDVRAERTGRIVELPVAEGDRVSAGDLLCRLDEEDAPARVEEARQRVRQAEIEYAGFKRLKDQAYQSETALATSQAQLAAARASLKSAELALERTRVRAPFDGILERRDVDLGDFLQAGAVCGTVVDPDPMLVTGFVPERRIANIAPGQAGSARLLTGETVSGTVRYVASVANAGTRTYRVELEVPNGSYDLRGGTTAELSLPVEAIRVHGVSSALLTLADDGTVGVRIVDADDRVRFLPVEVVDDAEGGVWISGLPDSVRIITVGQELVVDGDRVEVDLETGAGLVDGSENEEQRATSQRPDRPSASNRLPGETIETAAAAVPAVKRI